MTRPLVALAFLALPATASAQWVSGPPITNGASALYPLQMPVPPRFSVRGGSMSAPPQAWVPAGLWGGVYYPWPTFRAPARPAAARAETKLVVQFPASAEIWLDGEKAVGGPATEWTMTSSAVVGTTHTFEVKAQWKVGGTTYEVSRSVRVPAGNRSLWIVASGNEIKE